MANKKNKKQDEELPSDEELINLALNGEDDELYIASSDDVESTMKIKRARDEWEEKEPDED